MEFEVECCLILVKNPVRKIPIDTCPLFCGCEFSFENLGGKSSSLLCHYFGSKFGGLASLTGVLSLAKNIVSNLWVRLHQYVYGLGLLCVPMFL